MSDATIFNPFDRSWWTDPYPMYRRLLSGAACGRAGVLPVWYVARHADCDAALRDARLSADDRHSIVYRSFVASGAVQEEDEVPRSILRLDPPDHDRLRGLVASSFTRRAVEQLDALIQSTVRDLLEQIGDGVFDLVSSLGYPLPVTIIGTLLGVQRSEHRRLAELSRQVASALDPELTVDPEVLATRRAAFAELRADVGGLIERCRRDRRGGELVLHLLEAAGADKPEQNDAGGGPRASDRELVTMLVLLLIAGYETTANLIGNTALLLARRPDVAEFVAAHPAALPALVEEVLRLDPPVQLTSRIATEDLSVGSLEVPAGHFVMLLIAAANRDPVVFRRPDEVDLDRRGSRHLSFSAGVHHCLGALLARAEAKAAIGALLERWPRLELVAAPRYRETLVLRGLDELMLAPAA